MTSIHDLWRSVTDCRERRPRRRRRRSEPSATAASASTLSVAHSSVAPPTHTYIQTYNSQPTLPYTAASPTGVSRVSGPHTFENREGRSPRNLDISVSFSFKGIFLFCIFPTFLPSPGYGVSPPSPGQGVGGGATPLGVSKQSVVELHGKNQQIALSEFSLLVVLFLVLGQYLTQLWQVKGQIFGNVIIFQIYESIGAQLSIVTACNLHQRVPRSILHRMRCFDAFRLNI